MKVQSSASPGIVTLPFVDGTSRRLRKSISGGSGKTCGGSASTKRTLSKVPSVGEASRKSISGGALGSLDVEVPMESMESRFATGAGSTSLSICREPEVRAGR